MSKFRLKHPFGVYKVAPHKNDYISNKRMSDELAIEFLQHNPEKRINFFSEYPEDWRQLVGLDSLEQEAVVEATEDEQVEPFDEGETPVHKEEECSPCQKRKELEGMKMTELRAAYPDVTESFGMKKTHYIDKILEELYPEEDK